MRITVRKSLKHVWGEGLLKMVVGGGGGGGERGYLISQNEELCRFFKNWPGNGINSPYRTRKENGKAQANEVGDHAVEE